MAKKLLCGFLAVLLFVPLSGCWDYRGLNEITIVSGVAVDRNAEGNFHVTFEFIDVNSPLKDKPVQAKIVEADGKTLFDAARNAKRRLINKLYFPDMSVLIISKQIAQQEGLRDILDWFLRDSELRENMQVVISQQDTAREMLTIIGLDNSIVAYEMKEIAEEDQKTTSSVMMMPLYKIYGLSNSKGINVTLPSFHIVKNDDEDVVESNGQSVFKNDKLVGYLSPDETKYFLFATNGVKGGLLIAKTPQDKDVTYEIFGNKTKVSFTMEQGKPEFTVDTQTDVALDEVHQELGELKEPEVQQLEKAASDQLAARIAELIKRVQQNYDSDIFGFGNLIYRKDPGLWEQLENQWDELFKTVPVHVNSTVNIKNVAYIKK